MTKEGNCFTGGTDFQALNQIAKTLRAAHAVGRLTKVCDRWLYSACLCFALDSEERERSRFQYQYSFYQLENSRHVARNMFAIMCPWAICGVPHWRRRLAWRTARIRAHNFWIKARTAKREAFGRLATAAFLDALQRPMGAVRKV